MVSTGVAEPYIHHVLGCTEFCRPPKTGEGVRNMGASISAKLVYCFPDRFYL